MNCRGFRYYPCNSLVQRKMELNDGLLTRPVQCSAPKRLCELPLMKMMTVSLLDAQHWADVCCLGLIDLVELTGIEPVTSCLQSRRSPN